MAVPYGVGAKLDRARRHLGEIRDANRSMLQSWHAEIGRVTREDGDLSFRLSADAVALPELSGALGDFFHNARAALDHLAASIVRAEGQEVTTGPGGTTFPIRTRRTKRPLLDPTPSAELVDVLDAVQPYHQVAPELQPLAILHELNVFDKHHTLMVCSQAARGVGWFPGEGCELVAFNARPRPGDEVFRFRIPPGSTGEHLAPVPTVGILLEENAQLSRLACARYVSRQPIPDVCEHIYSHLTEDVIPRFEALVPALPRE